MKIRIAHIAIVLFFLMKTDGALAQDSLEYHLSKSIEHYDNEDYDAAYNGFTFLLDKGLNNTSLQYNLGNAALRKGSLGLAILHYEKALKFEPANEQALHNLKYAEKMRIDRFKEVPDSFLQLLLDNTIMVFPASIWAQLACLFMILGALLMAVYYFSMAKRKNRMAWRTLASILMFSGIFLVLLAVGRDELESKNKHVIIVSPNSYVYSAPSEKAESLFILHEGTKAALKEDYNEKGVPWIRVQLSDKKMGWMKAADAEII